MGTKHGNKDVSRGSSISEGVISEEGQCQTLYKYCDIIETDQKKIDDQ